MEFIKALHNVINKQKRKTGTRAYFANGEVYFSRLYGYRLVDGRYVPDERYAPAIRTVFEMLAAGKSLPEIKAILDGMKARDSSNNKYSISRICSIAERPIYCGFLYHHRRMVAVENFVPVISLETWKKAQRTLRIEKIKIIS